MKRTVIAEFNSTTALMAFKRAKQLTNCVVIENTLHCYLSDSDIDQLLEYGGRLVKETIIAGSRREAEMVAEDVCVNS